MNATARSVPLPDGDKFAEGVALAPRLLLSAADAARALSIGERTLARLVSAGEITPIHIGRSVRYSVQVLEDWIASRQGACVQLSDQSQPSI